MKEIEEDECSPAADRDQNLSTGQDDVPDLPRVPDQCHGSLEHKLWTTTEKDQERESGNTGDRPHQSEFEFQSPSVLAGLEKPALPIKPVYGSDSVDIAAARDVRNSKDVNMTSIAPFSSCNIDFNIDIKLDTDTPNVPPSNPTTLDPCKIIPSSFLAPPFPEPPPNLTHLPSSIHEGAPAHTSTNASQHVFTPASPPMFGPERVVLDPRIRAVHRQVMFDLLWMGTVWTVLFMVLLVCVPNRP